MKQTTIGSQRNKPLSMVFLQINLYVILFHMILDNSAKSAQPALADLSRLTM